MKRKKIISLILSAVMAVSNFTLVFSATIDEQYTETAEEICVSDSALTTKYSSIETAEVTDVSLNNRIFGDYEYYIISDGTAVICGYLGDSTEIVIPTELNGYTVSAIELCSDLLTSITISDGFTNISDYAFYKCTNLSNVVIPESVTSIGECAFENCTSLSSLDIPESVTNIGKGAFSGCTSLLKINIPNGITSISDSTFQSCTSLSSIDIPESVTSIGAHAFSNCTSLSSIDIPSSVTNFSEYTFSSCTSLLSIDIPDSETSIAQGLFLDCSSLTSITIPSGVTSIGAYAFGGCTGLTSIPIPSGVTSIGKYAFWSCTSLTDITIPSGVTSIEEGTFVDCTGLTSIPIPSGVTSIGKYAFFGCTSLADITIPNGVTSIEEGTFCSCSSLTSIIIPNGVTSIEKYAFQGCTSLTDITIPSGVTSIGEYAFNRCTSLTSVTIESTSAEISENAFSNCTNLKSVYCYKNSSADDALLYPDGVTIIYIEDEPSTETTTVSTTESTTETTTESATETTTESTTIEPSSEVTTENEAVAAPAFKVVGVFGGRSVTFTSETDGAVIYYSSSTSNITTDDICVQNGETVTYEDYYGTIYARAYYNGVWSDVNKFVLKIPVVNTPTVTASGSNVTIKSTTPSSFICYTTDGSEPVVETDGTVTNGTWLKVNGARTNSGTVTAEPGDTVRAVAVRSCFTTSASAAAYVSVSPAAFTVVGTFGGRNVTFKSDTSGAKIYYSSTTSSLTTSDKCVSNGETVLFEDFYGTIYARAYYNGKWSNVSRLILKIPTINTPTITYSGGKATIRTTTPNCYIYYTTDGTTPSITNGKKLCSNSYGQVTVSSGTTIKAIAVRSCFTNSEVVEYKVN